MPDQVRGQCLMVTHDGRFVVATGFSSEMQRHYIRIETGPGSINNSATPIAVALDATDRQGEIELAALSTKSILGVDQRIGTEEARAVADFGRRWFVTAS